MKKIFLKVFTAFLIMGMMASCTQNDDLDELLIETETQGCCGEGPIDPPPPPPPTGEGG
ncbi:hypothetical protein RQM59_06580 [Flavobacteriaceae bacterium S356]|uniref:Uncharacterized protein n=1 Tax=Asprobacillus argus TaxID=3076534 RepID=A0ABU3LEM2_9FLAO|nr:hypothetical protein [Flavobacteriaceae bacterium S356]